MLNKVLSTKRKGIYTMTENEFDKLYKQDDSAEASTNKTNSEVKEEIVVSGDAGLEYDFNKASKITKGPERENLDGKTVTITDMKIILPKPEKPWDLSRDKKTKYKSCMFMLFYDNEGQREYYSGVKVFEREVNGVFSYSDPNIQNSGKTQITGLKTLYAAYKNKKPEEVSMFEFLSFLKSQPKVELKWTPIEWNNSETGKDEISHKNFVARFI